MARYPIQKTQTYIQEKEGVSAEQILSNTAELHLASAKKSQTPGNADCAGLDDENLVYTVIRTNV